MPDAFFVSPKQRKRKRASSSAPLKAGASKKQSKPVPKRKRDEELDSENTDHDGGDVDDMDLRANYDEPESSEEDDPHETPAAKRLRLAKLYLEGVKKDIADGDYDAAEIDRELISTRLKQDVLEHSGKVYLFVADTYDLAVTSKAPSLRTRGHRFSVTSAVASSSGQYLFTAGKEGNIIKWDLHTGKKLHTFHKIFSSKEKGKAKAVDETGHTDEILALALSGDDRYLASGGRDRKLIVWDTQKNEWIKTLHGAVGHRDLISCLSFRKGTNQLYTGSFDRTIKVYDLSPSVMGYVETLFGHQDHIFDLDSLHAEACVSVGARDKTVRFWKVADETQLVFRGGGRSRVREVLEGGLLGEDEEEQPKSINNKFVEGSLESVCMIDESTFVSGGDSGSLSLWTTQKKKPVFTHPLAHGVDKSVSEHGDVVQKPRWVTAVAALRYSDLFASGSWDGEIRLWKLDSTLKSFSQVGSVTARGVVNSLQLLIPPNDFLKNTSWTREVVAALQTPPILVIAGMGQEHKMGRWLSVKEGAVNGSMVVVLTSRT